MRYSILREIVDQVVNEFRCPNCQKWATEDRLELIHASNKETTFTVYCSCGRHTIIGAEVRELDEGNRVSISHNAISEKDMDTVHDILEKNVSISELFRELDK